MTTTIGHRIKTVFVDEFHDIYAPHPDRKQQWDAACTAIAQIGKQRVFATATHPPLLNDLYRKKAYIVRTDERPHSIRAIRTSTVRLELAYYVLTLTGSHSSVGKSAENSASATALWSATFRLVEHLEKRLLEHDERIMVFFESCREAEYFSLQYGNLCALYHGTLTPDQKAENLGRWDDGTSPVLAATTAAAQGIDRPYVKFVIIHGSTYGMMPYVQQGGRAGRAGRDSFVILLRGPHTGLSRLNSLRKAEEGPDVQVIEPFIKYITNERVCRRRLLLNIMDGVVRSNPADCWEVPGCNACDICSPDSKWLKLVRAAAFPETTSHPAHPSAPSSGALSRGGWDCHDPSALSGLTTPIANKVGEAREGHFGKVSVSQPACPLPTTVTKRMFKKGAPLVASSSSADASATCVTRSISQPSRTSSTYRPPAIGLLSQPASNHNQSNVPAHRRDNPSSTAADRAQVAKRFEAARNTKADQLSRFLGILEGTCPVHFGSFGQLVNHPSSSKFFTCDLSSGNAFSLDRFKSFKKCFHFERYTHCYHCGSPQERSPTRAPKIHMDAGFSGKTCCWSELPYAVVFSIWLTEGVCDEMEAHFELNEKGTGPRMTDNDFGAWCNTEHPELGEHIKMLEVFLWYCERHLSLAGQQALTDHS